MLYETLLTESPIVGIPVFGPSAKAARMEGSKAFSKDFMQRNNIPTARYRTFTARQYEEAVDYVKTCGFKTVLKADGLAGGKGVLIPDSEEEAIAGLKDIMVTNVFGNAGTDMRRGNSCAFAYLFSSHRHM